MYIVTSKPNRSSVNSGLLQTIAIPPDANNDGGRLAASRPQIDHNLSKTSNQPPAKPRAIHPASAHRPASPRPGVRASAGACRSSGAGIARKKPQYIAAVEPWRIAASAIGLASHSVAIISPAKYGLTSEVICNGTLVRPAAVARSRGSIRPIRYDWRTGIHSAPLTARSVYMHAAPRKLGIRTVASKKAAEIARAHTTVLTAPSRRLIRPTSRLGTPAARLITKKSCPSCAAFTAKRR